MRLGSYPNGASDIEKRKLAQAVAAIGHSAAGIIPDGQKIEFVEAAKGTGEPFKTMMDWCESTQSKVILGGTLTSQADGKSSTNALGNVHNEVRHDLLVSDAMQIASSLNRFIKLICQVNGWQGRAPKFVFDTNEPEDLALFADAIPKLVAVGMNKIPVSFLYKKLKIPMAKEGEEILGVSQAQTVVTSKTALSMDLTSIKFTPEQQVIEKIADDLLDNVTAPLSNEALQQVIRTAKSPEDLEKRLVILMAKADFSEFSDTLSKALFAADCLGYAHSK
jgi:phage gp29-like protein